MKKRFTEEQIIGFLREAEAGMPIAELLAKRHLVYQQARERNPERWAGKTRNWTPVGDVRLNPEREEMPQPAVA
jgi:hypothetical protein